MTADQFTERAQFKAWNTAGRWVGRLGRVLYRLGLSLSGWSGWLDAKADSYRG